MNNDKDFSISNIELINLFKKYKMPLTQICSKDKLQGLPKPGNYIINLADERENGTHWVCFIIRNNQCMYYDSFGITYPNDVKKFIKQNPNIQLYYNTDQVQHLDSSTCGFYCLAFINYCHNHPKQDLYYLLNIFNHQFSEDTEYNDKLLQKIIINMK
jgi:hypothetical protein